jgi:ketosteroid isomerase-like protein
MHVAGRPPVAGRAAIRQFYGTMFTFIAASRVTPDTLLVSGSEDMAYSIGRSENEFKGAQGPASHAGKYLIVWQRQAGEWLIAAYSISSDQ